MTINMQSKQKNELQNGERRPYTPPSVTPLGRWQAVTLVISVPIGPGVFSTPQYSDHR